MASIKRNIAQEEALQFISDSLTQIKAFNALLIPGWKGEAVIQFDTGGNSRNKYVKVTVAEDDKDLNTLLKLVKTRKTKLVKEIKDRAEKYDIELGEEDREVMAPVKERMPAENKDDNGCNEGADVNDETDEVNPTQTSGRSEPDDT